MMGFNTEPAVASDNVQHGDQQYLDAAHCHLCIPSFSMSDTVVLRADGGALHAHNGARLPKQRGLHKLPAA